MTLGFTELMNTIEAEIRTEYIGGAIQWADQNFDNAWSKALTRFDKALGVAIDRQDYTLAKVEADFYKITVVELLKKYKAAKAIDDKEAFLASIRKHSA